LVNSTDDTDIIYCSRKNGILEKYFYYNLYTLNIASEFELKGFPALSEKPQEIDYEVSEGIVQKPPSDLPNTQYRTSSICNPEIFYLDVPVICNFYMEASGTIKVQLKKNKITRDCLPFLYDTVLSVALMYQNKFSLRASAVVGVHGVNVFCGGYGIGKSTIATILYHNGFPFIEDNRCIFSWNEKHECYTATNLYPNVHLWQDIGRSTDKTKLVPSWTPRENIFKRQYSLLQKNIAHKNYKVHKIYLLQAQGDLEITEVPIKGLVKTKMIKDYIYHSQFVDILNKSDALFDFLARLASQAEVSVLKKYTKIPIDEFVKHVAHEINTP